MSKLTKEDLITAFQIGWESAEDYDSYESALEDFVGKMEAKEKDDEIEAFKKGYIKSGIDRLNEEGEAMEDMRLRRDSR
jgi:hypothetical protein